MGEYISLLASVRAGEVVDIPRAVCRRYDTCLPALDPGQVRVTLDVHAAIGPGERLYVTGNTPGLGDLNEGLAVPARRIEEGRWRALFEAPSGHMLRFGVSRRNADGSRTPERPGGDRRRVLPARADGTVVLETSATF
jgi:glucoamylase